LSLYSGLWNILNGCNLFSNNPKTVEELAAWLHDERAERRQEFYPHFKDGAASVLAERDRLRLAVANLDRLMDILARKGK
jgi:hypothetical protein